MQLWELIEALTAPGIDQDADTNVINLTVNRCYKDGRTVVVVSTVPMVQDGPEDPEEMEGGWAVEKTRDLVPALKALPVEPYCTVRGAHFVEQVALPYQGRRLVMLKTILNRNIP